jgi:hypothetical protein
MTTIPLQQLDWDGGRGKQNKEHGKWRIKKIF